MQLELLAGYSDLRLNYKMASHEVHADSRGLVSNQAIESDVNYMEVGPSIVTSAEPAYHALVAACQTGNSMLLAGPVESAASDILGARALAVLIETCGDELAAAQR